MGGYAGFHDGQVIANNIQSGSVDITTDANGDGTASVTFPKKFKSVPKVFIERAESDITGTSYVTGKTVSGCYLNIDGSSVTGGTLTVDWFAHHYQPY